MGRRNRRDAGSGKRDQGGVAKERYHVILLRCGERKVMPERIPDNWRTAVVNILKGGHSDRIEVCLRAWLDFQSLFSAAFTYEIYDAFILALKDPELLGNRVYGMKPEGEFIFTYQRKQVYGKVCLTKDKRLVVIFSAHRPLKGETL